MKIHTPRSKFFLSVLYITVSCYTSLNAQKNPAENYLKQVGNYAEIYNGQMEENYNTLLYDNLPYYQSSDFTEATLIYRKNYFPHQKVRLDLFREQLILLTPDERFGIVLNSPCVDKVIMYDKTFRWLNPAKESGLKPGFYIHLFGGKGIQLFCKEHYSLQNNQLTANITHNTRFYWFERSVRYYLFYNNQYYTVKNKGSFSNLFPQYKKQINQFVKTNKLNFKKDNSSESLASLAGYCEELLTLTSRQ